MPPKTSSSQLTEEEIQFKKRANRRLLGAVALVVVLVVLLPMLLDDRAQKAPQQEIAITIPGQDGGEFTSKIVPVTPDETIEELPPVTREPDTQSTPAGNKPQQNGAGQAGQDKQPETAKLLLPAESKTRESIVIPTGKDPGAAPAKPEKTESASPGTATAVAAVQIGVFSDAAKIRQMQDTLKSLGYRTYTEKLETSRGEKIRLRAGPFSSRPAAEAALEKIKAAGLTGMVISGK